MADDIPRPDTGMEEGDDGSYLWSKDTSDGLMCVDAVEYDGGQVLLGLGPDVEFLDPDESPRTLPWR